MTTALEDCFEMLKREVTSNDLTPDNIPERSMRLAVLTLDSNEEKRAFLDSLTGYYRQTIVHGIRHDILSPYVISRLKRARPIRDVAEEIARFNLSLAAGKMEYMCPDFSKEWYNFLINC